MTVTELGIALVKSADLVGRWGPKYLCYFERLEAELTAARKRDAALARAHEVSRKGAAT